MPRSRLAGAVLAFLRPSRTEGRRPALDGLRAVAVLLVFAFHVGAPKMSGGFLGVDLFFVLSGYLITQLLFIEIEKTDRVAVGAFWARRVRRLLPAFAVVTVAVIVWGAWKAPGFLRARVQRDVLASIVYLGNWRFIASSSYFANDDTVSPLQHVWSLAIEEQFYVLWPGTVALSLVVARARKWPIARVVGVFSALVGAGSVVMLSVLYTPTHPERAYMGTETRAFEPLLGAVLASLCTSPRVRAFAARFRHALFVGGLTGCVVGVVTLGSPTGISRAYFMGGAVAFALSCCQIILAVESGDSLFARALSLGPLEKLGAISYGFYLWHWPLIVWVMGTSVAFNPSRAALVLGAVIVVSAVSYFAIERPVRSGAIGKRLSVRTLAWATPAALFALCAATWLAVKPPPKQGFTVLLVGDSVPKRLLPFVATEAEKRHWFVYSAAVGGCATFPYLIVDHNGQIWNSSDECPVDVPKLQHDLVVDQRPDVVVWWSRYDVCDRIEPDGRHIRPDAPEFWKAQEDDLRAEVDRLTRGGARILFVEQDRPGRGLVDRCTKSNCHWFVKQVLEHYDWAERWNKMVRDTAAVDPRIKVVSLDDVFCHDHAVPCDDSFGSGLARPDGAHFSPEFGPIIANALLDRVGER